MIGRQIYLPSTPLRRSGSGGGSAAVAPAPQGGDEGSERHDPSAGGGAMSGGVRAELAEFLAGFHEVGRDAT